MRPHNAEGAPTSMNRLGHELMARSVAAATAALLVPAVALAQDDQAATLADTQVAPTVTITDPSRDLVSGHGMEIPGLGFLDITSMSVSIEVDELDVTITVAGHPTDLLASALDRFAYELWTLPPEGFGGAHRYHVWPGELGRVYDASPVGEPELIGIAGSVSVWESRTSLSQELATKASPSTASLHRVPRRSLPRHSHQEGRNPTARPEVPIAA